MVRNYLAEFYSKLPKKFKKRGNKIVPQLPVRAARGKKELHSKIDSIIFGKKRGGKRR